MLSKKFNLNLISKFRNELMGLSALGIIACHALPNGLVMPTPFAQLASMGQIGVIVFFLLSGLGVFYSLSNHKGSILGWYKKRYIRIAIPYGILAIPFFIFYECKNGGNVIDFMLSISTIGFWLSSKQVVWFIAILLPMYLITPPIFYILYLKINDLTIRTFLFIAIIAIIIAIGDFLPQFDSFFNQGLFYFIGLWVAQFVKSNTRISGILICTLSLIVFPIMAIVPFLNELPRLWVLLPAFLIMTCIILEKIAQLKIPFILAILSFMGNISLESYLTNIFVGGLLSNFNSTWQHLPLGFYIKYACIIIFGIILAWICHRLSVRFQRRIFPTTSKYAMAKYN